MQLSPLINLPYLWFPLIPFCLENLAWLCRSSRLWRLSRQEVSHSRQPRHLRLNCLKSLRSDFRVLFTFASSPLSESLEQAIAYMRQCLHGRKQVSNMYRKEVSLRFGFVICVLDHITFREERKNLNFFGPSIIVGWINFKSSKSLNTYLQSRSCNGRSNATLPVPTWARQSREHWRKRLASISFLPYRLPPFLFFLLPPLSPFSIAKY